MSRKVWQVLAAVIVLSLLISLPALGGEKLTKVRLSEVVRSVFYAPQYVALAKGFFEEEGLEIELSTAWGVLFCRDT